MRLDPSGRASGRSPSAGQRLRHVVGGLVIVHHALEPADRRGVQVLPLVPAADLHLLCRRDGRGTGRSSAARRGHRRCRESGSPPPAAPSSPPACPSGRAGCRRSARSSRAPAGNRHRHVAMRRMQLDVAVQRGQRLGVVVLQVLRVRRHQLRVRRPGRVRIVLLHQVELVDRRGIALALQRIDAVVVQRLDRRVGGGGVVAPPCAWRRSRRAAAAAARGQARSGGGRGAARQGRTGRNGRWGERWGERAVSSPRFIACARPARRGARVSPSPCGLRPRSGPRMGGGVPQHGASVRPPDRCTAALNAAVALLPHFCAGADCGQARENADARRSEGCTQIPAEPTSARAHHGLPSWAVQVAHQRHAFPRQGSKATPNNCCFEPRFGFAIRATSRDSDGVTASMPKRKALAIAQRSG